MKKLIINVNPTVFNYSGYILDDASVQELTVIPQSPTDLVTFAANRGVNTVVLHGASLYVRGLKEQLEKKLDIKIELDEV